MDLGKKVDMKLNPKCAPVEQFGCQQTQINPEQLKGEKKKKNFRYYLRLVKEFNHFKTQLEQNFNAKEVI